MAACLLAGPAAVAQFTYQPGTKLIILHVDAPLPDRSLVEAALGRYANEHRFTTHDRLGQTHLSYGRDPDVTLNTTFTSRSVTVVLWRDPNDPEPYATDVAQLAAALEPLGFRRLSDLPRDPE